MDLETENQIASILMKEARRQAAEKEAYLGEKKNVVRFRPNSRFLTTTLLGVQQANKVAEVNDLWRVRNQELEMNNKYKGTTSIDHHIDSSPKATSSGRRKNRDDGGGFKDEELEQFLHSRAKRARGGVGARMDEPERHVLGPENPDKRCIEDEEEDWKKKSKSKKHSQEREEKRSKHHKRKRSRS